MSTISKITKSILFSTACAVCACSGGDTSDKQTEESFPVSATMRQAEERTAILPAKPAVAEPTPIVDSAVRTEAVEERSVVEPTTFVGWMKRGRSRFQAGELSGALIDFQKAVEMRPENQQARIQLARTFLALDKPSDARPHVEHALEIDGSSSFGWNTMGRVELAEGEHEAAIASFERATEEDADNSYAWNNLGFVLIEEGLYEEAVAALEEATSGGTPQPYMWNNLGMAYEHQDQIELARAAYRQAGDGGSAKALANFQRLEGVTSLVATSSEEEGIGQDAPAAVAEALELEEPDAEAGEGVVGNEDGASASMNEVPVADSDPIEVAEVVEVEEP